MYRPTSVFVFVFSAGDDICVSWLLNAQYHIVQTMSNASPHALTGLY